MDGLVSAGGCPITFPGSRLETELGAIRENEVWGAGEGDGNAGDEKIDSKGSGRCGFSTLCTIRPKGARWVGLSDSTFVPSILSGYTTRRLMRPSASSVGTAFSTWESTPTPLAVGC